MNYCCIDRGSSCCPCQLMPAGQCYTCTMIRNGSCSCEMAAGWQGSCPYTEYLQQGQRVLQAEKDSLQVFPVSKNVSYGGGLFLIQLAVSAGFAQQCRQPGAYVMAEALGWRTPVSVLRVSSVEGGRGRSVDFLLKAAGPKTQVLAGLDNQGPVMQEETAKKRPYWQVAGPYFNGLLHSETLFPAADARAEKRGRLTLVIARGTAAAPYVNLRDQQACIKESIQEEESLLYLDDEALPEAFAEEYLEGQVYEKIRLTQPETVTWMKEKIRNHLKRKDSLVAVLVSPYYVEALTRELSDKEKERVIIPNPASLCCAAGICGACSHTDKDGITVRLCKCNGTVIK